MTGVRGGGRGAEGAVQEVGEGVVAVEVGLGSSLVEAGVLEVAGVGIAEGAEAGATVAEDLAISSVVVAVVGPEEEWAGIGGAVEVVEEMVVGSWEGLWMLSVGMSMVEEAGEAIGVVGVVDIVDEVSNMMGAERRGGD